MKAPRSLEGHEQLVLTSEFGWARITKGHFALYAVVVEDGQPQGQRYSLVTLNEGSLLFGVPVDFDDHRFALLAVPLDSECEIQELEGDDLLAGHSEERAKIWDRISQECRLFTNFLVKNTAAPPYAERSNEEGRFRFDPGIVFKTSSREMSWLQLERGSVLVLGDENELLTHEDPPVAAGPGLWFQVVEEAEGCFLPVEPVLEDSEALQGFLEGAWKLTQLVLIRARDMAQQESEAEVRRLETLALQRARADRSVVQHLSLDLGDSDEIEVMENPLMTALTALGKFQGIQFNLPPKAAMVPDRHERIAAIVRASDTRMRRVKMYGEWWNDDSGAILAFKKKNGAPVALLNTPRWGGMVRHYEIIDTETETRTNYDPDTADELEDDAYTFVSPLPRFDDGLKAWELSRFTVSPYFGDAKLLFLMSLVGSVLAMIPPMANMLMMDHVIPDANRDLILDLAIGMAAVNLGMFVFQLSQGLITLRIQTSMTARLQAAVIDRLLRLPTRFFRNYSTGDLLNRSMMIHEISGGLSGTAVKSILGLLNVAMMLALCFYYNQKLAFLAVITAFVTSVISLSFSFALKKIALEKEIESGKLNGYVLQMIHGVSKLQVAGAEERAFGKWAERYGELIRMEYRMDRMSQTSGVINSFLQLASSAALFYLAGRMIEQSVAMQAASPLAPPLLTIGTFFAFQGAFSGAVGGIVGFFGSFLTIHQLMAKRDLVKPILEAPVESSPDRVDPGPIQGGLKVSNATFRYTDNGPTILDRVTLQAYPGEFVAIVGPSGCGKSTLLRLLLGFETPESGSVLIDGKDMSTLDLGAVRRQIGTVLQDGSLNGGTIYHIIAGARPISMDEAWAAAEEAGFAEDLKGMPMGMHTLLPEGAPTLSGGQRQRLMIARALALDPRIVIFDEATSALDNRTQSIVTKSLDKRKVTRIVVAHRLSTIKDADRIYVVDKGSVIESGNFESLMAEKGLFHRLAIRQIAAE